MLTTLLFTSQARPVSPMVFLIQKAQASTENILCDHPICMALKKNIQHIGTLLETSDFLLPDARIEDKFDLYGPVCIVKDLLKV